MYYFSWYDAAAGLVRILRGWKGISIYSHNGAHWQRVLRKHGIKSKAAAIVSEGVVIQVRKGDYNRAIRILKKAGATLA